MKHIRKGPVPGELQRWFDGQRIDGGPRINCRYGDIPTEVKDAVKERLLEDQGGLCCYTGIAIDMSRSHIEHLKPRALCENHEDVEYANMLAAYPSENRRRCPFGAKAKENWYDLQLLVNPLESRCETRFRFNLSGTIQPAQANDAAAVATIQHLHLDHEQLIDMRRHAIEEVILEKELTQQELERVIANWCRRDNTRQRFPEFCFVIVQAAREMLDKRKREAKRMQAIRSQSRAEGKHKPRHTSRQSRK